MPIRHFILLIFNSSSTSIDNEKKKKLLKWVKSYKFVSWDSVDEDFTTGNVWGVQPSSNDVFGWGFGRWKKGELNVIFYYLVRINKLKKKEKWLESSYFYSKKKKKLALIKKEGTSAAIPLPRNGGNSSIPTCVQSTVQHSIMKV